MSLQTNLCSSRGLCDHHHVDHFKSLDSKGTSPWFVDVSRIKSWKSNSDFGVITIQNHPLVTIELVNPVITPVNPQSLPQSLSRWKSRTRNAVRCRSWTVSCQSCRPAVLNAATRPNIFLGLLHLKVKYWQGKNTKCFL